MTVGLFKLILYNVPFTSTSGIVMFSADTELLLSTGDNSSKGKIDTKRTNKNVNISVTIFQLFHTH